MTGGVGSAERFEAGELRFAEGEPPAVDRVVALPALNVPRRCDSSGVMR